VKPVDPALKRQASCSDPPEAFQEGAEGGCWRRVRRLNR